MKTIYNAVIQRHHKHVDVTTETCKTAEKLPLMWAGGASHI